MFFYEEVYPLIQELDSAGNVIGPDIPFAGNNLGWFIVPLAQPDPPGKLRVTCENLVFECDLTQAEIGAGHVADIFLPNRKPRAASFLARLNNQVVQSVPPGTSVNVNVIASDPDGDPLHFEWGASAGTATNTNTPQATWTLPNSRG